MAIISAGSIVTSATAFSGGTALIAGLDETIVFNPTSALVTGDTVTMELTNTQSGLITEVGAGDVTGKVPVFVFNYNNKMYALAGAVAYFTAITSATIWNDPNGTGNGSVTMSDFTGTPMQVLAVAHYQGRLAFFSREAILIYNVNADPAQWTLAQTLQNIGTVAPLTVQSVGDLDVYFLSDSGFRNLRVRDNTLNAVPDDEGSPIDTLIQAVLTGASPNTAAACGIIEPSSKRRWFFLKDTIYVLSKFASSKVTAWSTYKATYSNAGTQTAFVPSKFCIYAGQVYARGTDGAIYQYGGTDNNTYDSVKCKWQTGFLDGGSPGTLKTGRAIDCVFNALLSGPDTWNVYASMDEKSAGDPTSSLAAWKKIYANTVHSFDLGTVAYTGTGTHISLYGETIGTAGPAVFSQVLFYYDNNNQKG